MSPPSEAQKFRLTSPLRASTYNVSPLVRSRTSCPEKPAELHPVAASRVRRTADSARVMMDLLLRETPRLREFAIPFLGSPAIRILA
jgi:hypothetical protein